MKYLITAAIAALTISCNTAPSPVVQTTPSGNTTSERSQTAIAHSSENKAAGPASGTKSKWTQSGDPIDTTTFDKAVADAEKELAAKPDNTAAKKALADAYFKRAMALTDARQYASALGDYRKTVKNDPAQAEAKEWIDRIVQIYDSIGKESPAEGQEPPPLPFTKK